MQVHIPTPLYSYTGSQRVVEAEGATVGLVLDDLDRLYPGLRFRVVNEQENIREHVHIFVNRELARSLDHPISPTDSMHIIMAISGG